MARELSIEALLSGIEPGETVFVAGSSGEPVEISAALEAYASLAAGARFVTSFVPGINGRNLAAARSDRRMRVFFMQPAYAELRRQGLIEFAPLNYHGIAQYLSDERTPLDTAIVQVGEPDADGLCSLGPAAEFMPIVLRRARRILAVINDKVPTLVGAPKLSLDRVNAYARSSAALPQYDAGRSNEVATKIAAYLAALIPHGATLQLGLGKIPSQLLPALNGHRNLAFHSGMLSDRLIDMLASSALAERPLTTTVVVGSPALYERLPSIQNLHLVGVEHTHHPETLAALPKLHAINSALEVDLSGQVNAERLDGRSLSGPGGLPDFAAAAHRQADGLSVIALPSTDPSGKLSRIVASFAAGTPVSVPQHDIDAVVTEYGVARLRGIGIDERMQRLIGVAHPHHREALAAAARQALAQA